MQGNAMKNKKPVLIRRDFIRGTVTATIGASIFPFNQSKTEAAATGSSVVTIARDKNVMDTSLNIDQALLRDRIEQTLIRVTRQKNPRQAW